MILRLRESLLSLHQRLDELASAENAAQLAVEVEPLRRALLEQIQQTRSALTRFPPEIRLDPAALPTLEALEIALPSQIEAITSLASSGDWNAVRLRLANEMRPLEAQTSSLVKSIDLEVSEELTIALENMASVQRRIFIIVPITAICTLLIAAYFGWGVAQRIIEMRLDERVSERMRITRELHDTFLQTVQGSKLVADDALEGSRDPVRMRRAMEQLSVWLGQASQEGRAALSFQRDAPDCS